MSCNCRWRGDTDKWLAYLERICIAQETVVLYQARGSVVCTGVRCCGIVESGNAAYRLAFAVILHFLYNSQANSVSLHRREGL